MAQKYVTTYTDDLTGEASEEITTHRLLVDGAGVEIDLTPDNHDGLLEALSPYLNAKDARRIREGKSKQRKAEASSSGPSAEAMRTWAREQGIEVNDRGRVPADVREKFEAAH